MSYKIVYKIGKENKSTPTHAQAQTTTVNVMSCSLLKE